MKTKTFIIVDKLREAEDGGYAYTESGLYMYPNAWMPIVISGRVRYLGKVTKVLHDYEEGTTTFAFKVSCATLSKAEKEAYEKLYQINKGSHSDSDYYEDPEDNITANLASGNFKSSVPKKDKKKNKKHSPETLTGRMAYRDWLDEDDE